MTDVQDRKAALRARAFDARKADHGRGLDAAANARLLEWIGRAEGEVIAGYMPIRTEISPLPAMTQLAQSATVCVPVVQGAGQPLVFHRWTPGCAMVEGAFGAAVPAEAHPVTPTLVIVPLVAFDASRGRLGYGGGFYDRTLALLRARNPRVRAVGFAYDAQEVSAVPLEPTDQPLDALVTPMRVM